LSFQNFKFEISEFEIPPKLASVETNGLFRKAGVLGFELWV
jgi:hypothetical protein